MTDIETLDERLRAVERALTDGDRDFDELADSAELTARADELDRRVATLESRVDDLDAAVQAVRGYVGNVRAVNREVEQRADAALAATESLTGDRDRTPSPDDSAMEASDGASSCRTDEGSDCRTDDALDPGFVRRIREVL